LSSCHFDLGELGHQGRNMTCPQREGIECNPTVPREFRGGYYRIQKQKSEIQGDSTVAILKFSKAVVGNLDEST
jgi:hypothetical protein